MKRCNLIILILLLASAWSLHADIRIYLRDVKKTQSLPTTVIDGRDYVCLQDLSAIFHSITREERSDHRVHLHIYGEQFIFLTGSSYYRFQNDSYNMHFPLVRRESRFHLPAVFLTEHLPRHFSKDVEYKANLLHVKPPKDHCVKVIVLDPGHGGKDPGAVGKGKTREKDINLAVSLKLKQLLEKELGLKVLMTRDDDRFITLAGRTKFANDNRADLFVSVHSNASNNRAARGLETFYLSTALTSDARAVEALENAVVEEYEGRGASQKYDDLAFILSDLSQTEHLENSNNLAIQVQQNMVAGTKGGDRGVKQANFYVLKGAFMPAVLIELGFISNPDEEKLLANDQYQERLARTIFEGIKRFKYRFDRIRNA
ncbi:MAG: N-acetylmuramoyl-L-alanine amidase [Candidatus Cloacimonadaceae bacterium]|nr:N-acetylmuramoyl-L-alanine amidase [Candidatus Cloacimonadaceae bacterium]MDP3115150.1 N-acetylmuramoyl-L-alanine amidase [Candidatus Cloacimonadaceae bacterium]